MTIQGYALLAGGRAAEVMLDDVRVPSSARLGKAGEAFAAIEARIAAANVAQCAETLGAMETATHLTSDYLMTRKQFGRPDRHLPGAGHRMADLLIEMEQARSAVINAAGHLEGEPQEPRKPRVSAQKICWAAQAVWWPRTASRLHGGIAMTQGV